jgi:hypothetical protein
MLQGSTERKTDIKMKDSIFWDIMPCNPLKINQYFRGTFDLHHHGRRVSLKVGVIYFSERLVIFNGLHSVISQKIELFITIAVRTLDPRM